jgi:uncharacterized membrane protein
MFDSLFGLVPASKRGFVSILLGLILILGALSKLGFLQGFLDLILVAVGLMLIFQGLEKTNLLKKIKKS